MEEFLRSYSRLCRERGAEPQETVLQRLHELPRGRLDLATQSLTLDTCRALGALLPKEAQLTELVLSDCMLSEEGATLLLQGLCANTILRLLDLKGNNLQAKGAEALGKLLRQNKSIQSLTLEWNNLGAWEDAFATFCRALAGNLTLRQLDLRNNQISHQGAEELALALKGRHLPAAEADGGGGPGAGQPARPAGGGAEAAPGGAAAGAEQQGPGKGGGGDQGAGGAPGAERPPAGGAGRPGGAEGEGGSPGAAAESDGEWPPGGAAGPGERERLPPREAAAPGGGDRAHPGGGGPEGQLLAKRGPGLRAGVPREGPEPPEVRGSGETQERQDGGVLAVPGELCSWCREISAKSVGASAHLRAAWAASGREWPAPLPYSAAPPRTRAPAKTCGRWKEIRGQSPPSLPPGARTAFCSVTATAAAVVK
uniref:Leucine rich repeat containing 45 n=1 Tax=Myotis myotis TaxID=51298 RepID=A0A7J7T6A2_MYOMY|nr:leucine rich repeat containing 45 [Myotis myotis]